jgi:hypothetical protein
VHQLATDPTLQDRMRAEPEPVGPFIEEMLRLESPFRYHFRQVRSDIGLAGTDVPAGSAVLLILGHREPRSCRVRPPGRRRAGSADAHHLASAVGSTTASARP